MVLYRPITVSASHPPRTGVKKHVPINQKKVSMFTCVDDCVRLLYVLHYFTTLKRCVQWPCVFFPTVSTDFVVIEL